MISKLALEERVREWNLREDVVEKDYVIGWLLWGIGSEPVLAEKWAFKGGTCLKKCYVETYRFSEDLDFTVLPGGPVLPDDIRPHLVNALTRVAEECGIDFSERQPLLRGHASGNYTEDRVYYRGPRGAPTIASIRLDLSASERVACPTVLRPIAHAYPDALPGPGTVRCYAFEEVFAEKIRAMGERSRPRDLYDIVNLYRRVDLRGDPVRIRQVLEAKCSSKGVPMPTFEALESSGLRTELESEWGNMLAHQLPSLPPLADFWSELPGIFAWLAGAPVEAVLASFAASTREDIDPTWSPSPTISTWGVGVPMESIRFAAANHLCVELGYDRTKRIIEPYSLRRSRAGNLLLYAVRADSREPRAYRVDRIESVHITDRTFHPVYRVELAATGAISATPLASVVRPARSRTTRRTSRTGGVVYVVQCPFCQKRFRRQRMSDTRLNDHKTKEGLRCNGSGRTGYVVGTGQS